MTYPQSHPAAKYIAEQGISKYKVITVRAAITVKSEVLSDESGTIELVQKKRGKTLESRNRYSSSYSIVQAAKRIYRKKGVSDYDLITYKVDKGYSAFAYFTAQPVSKPAKKKATPQETIRLLKQELQQVKSELVAAKQLIKRMKEDTTKEDKPNSGKTGLMVVTDNSWGGVYTKIKSELGYYVNITRNTINNFTKRKDEGK